MGNFNHKAKILVIISAIASAFGKKPPAYTGNVYHAISDGMGGFHWSLYTPNTNYYSCATGPAYCTIITIGGYIPQTNIVPTIYQAIPTSTLHRNYQLQLYIK
jgi:hypothetical protein